MSLNLRTLIREVPTKARDLQAEAPVTSAFLNLRNVLGAHLPAPNKAPSPNSNTPSYTRAYIIQYSPNRSQYQSFMVHAPTIDGGQPSITPDTIIKLPGHGHFTINKSGKDKLKYFNGTILPGIYTRNASTWTEEGEEVEEEEELLEEEAAATAAAAAAVPPKAAVPPPKAAVPPPTAAAPPSESGWSRLSWGPPPPPSPPSFEATIHIYGRSYPVRVSSFDGKPVSRSFGTVLKIEYKDKNDQWEGTFTIRAKGNDKIVDANGQTLFGIYQPTPTKMVVSLTIATGNYQGTYPVRADGKSEKNKKDWKAGSQVNIYGDGWSGIFTVNNKGPDLLTVFGDKYLGSYVNTQGGGSRRVRPTRKRKARQSRKKISS